MLKLYPSLGKTPAEGLAPHTCSVVSVLVDWGGLGREWIRREDQTVFGSVFALIWTTSDCPYIQVTEV